VEYDCPIAIVEFSQFLLCWRFALSSTIDIAALLLAFTVEISLTFTRRWRLQCRSAHYEVMELGYWACSSFHLHRFDTLPAWAGGWAALLSSATLTILEAERGLESRATSNRVVQRRTLVLLDNILHGSVCWTHACISTSVWTALLASGTLWFRTGSIRWACLKAVSESRRLGTLPLNLFCFDTFCPAAGDSAALGAFLALSRRVALDLIRRKTWNAAINCWTGALVEDLRPCNCDLH